MNGGGNWNVGGAFGYWDALSVSVGCVFVCDCVCMSVCV